MEFLVLAVGLTVVGITVVVVRNRRPAGLEAGIEDFERRRAALAPTRPREPGRRDQRAG